MSFMSVELCSDYHSSNLKYSQYVLDVVIGNECYRDEARCTGAYLRNHHMHIMVFGVRGMLFLINMKTFV